jgi:hypothetical protein
MPNARDKNVTRLGKNNVAHNVTRCAKADYDLANVSVFRGHPERRKILQSVYRRPNHRQRTSCGVGILTVEKSSKPLDVFYGVVRKEDHPTLRACGRGSSSADPQLATHALMSSSGTARRVR